ncbi:MAG: YkgJ family cysteine cluster protein [Desulfobacteraceae bacterium]|nr:MAG: YkgJ family cysteine cluster protein [Desulfobacteraceae bacterium]
MSSDRRHASDFFQCTQCGHCCSGYGGTFVGERDIEAIAEYLGLPAKEVRERFCVLSANRSVLAQGADGYCIFWEKICTIHPVKPLMCRRWPFIPSLLVDVTNWQIMADSCPGIHRGVDTKALLAYAHAVIGSTPKD